MGLNVDTKLCLTLIFEIYYDIDLNSSLGNFDDLEFSDISYDFIFALVYLCFQNQRKTSFKRMR